MNCHGLKYPYRTVEHPYIQRRSERNYGMGNICFGDHHRELQHSIHRCDWETLDHILRQWASLYHLGSTGPLNGIQECKIGNLKEYTASTTDPELGMERLSSAGLVSERRCKKEFRNNTWIAKDFVAEFCSQCTHQPICTYHQESLDPNQRDRMRAVLNHLSEGFLGLKKNY